MRKLKFVSVFVLLALLLSAGPGAVASQWSPPQDSVSAVGSCKASANCPTELSAKPISGWLRYEDPDYGFALEYPADEWATETAIQQPVPFPFPSAIIKRQTFSGPGSLIDLDVWLSHGKDLSTWLEWYAATRSPLPKITLTLNAEVAGQPAVVFLDEGQSSMLTTFFSDGRYVYRLWYTVIGDERGLQAYWHMLDTFSLPESRLTGTHIPQSVMQSAQQALETLDNCATTDDDCDSVYGQGCCGYHSGNCTWKFPCSRKNGHDLGNCTYWVCYKYGGVPFHGDAWTWWGQAPDYAWQGWARGSRPSSSRPSIAWWNKGAPPNEYGHVAFVRRYYGGGTVTISEMLWCDSCGSQRTIDVYQPGGYIYRVSLPPERRASSMSQVE